MASLVPAAPLVAIVFMTIAAPSGSASPGDAHGEAYYSYCLSQQAWYRQDYEQALQYMEKAVASDPNSPELAVDLARLRLELNQPEEAALAARHAAEMTPSSAAPQRVLADALFMISMRDNAAAESIEQAYQAYRKVIDLDADDAEALLNLAKLQISKGDLDGSLASLQRHLELAPGSDEGVFIASQVLVKLGRFTEAVGLLGAAVQRSPESAQLGLALVDAYEAKGDLEAAAAAARRLLQLRVDPVRVQFVMARLSQRMGKPAEAYDHLQEMSRLMDTRPTEFSDGDRAEVELRMIQSLLDAGRIDDALSRSETGVSRFAADPRFAMRKGEALLMAGRGSEAESLFRQGLKSSGGRRADRGSFAQEISETYLSAAARQERSGRVDEAETLLKKSIEWNSQNASALNYLGYMLADRGTRLDEAIGYIRKALDRDPHNGAYLDSLGWAYFKKKQFAEAEKKLEEALSNMAEEPAIHDHLGDVYYATGRREDAVRAWKEALDRGAENPEQIRAKLAAADQPSGNPR